MPDRFEYLLRKAQTDFDIGEPVGFLPVIRAELDEELNTPSILRLDVHFSFDSKPELKPGAWIEIKDSENIFGNDTLQDGVPAGPEPDTAIYEIQTIRTVRDTNGSRFFQIEADDPLGRLARFVIPSYRAYPEQDKTVQDIITDLLIIKNELTPDQWSIVPGGSGWDTAIRSINVENESILEIIRKIGLNTNTFFKAFGTFAVQSFRLKAFPLGSDVFPQSSSPQPVIQLGRNFQSLKIEKDTSRQANLIYMFGRGQDETKVRMPTAAQRPSHYWALNQTPHDVYATDNAFEHMTEVNSPTYTQAGRSPDTVFNGDLSTTTGWSAGAGWTLNQFDRRFEAAPATGTSLTKAFADDQVFSEGDTYVLRFVIIHASGDVLPKVFGEDGTTISSDGVFEQEFTVPEGAYPREIEFDATALEAFIYNVELRLKDDEQRGLITSALRVDGVNQCLRYTPFAAYDRLDPFSIELWFRIDSLPTVSGAFEALWSDASGTSPENNFFSLGIHYNGTNTRVTVRQRVAGVNSDSRGMFTNLQAGVWYHVVMVYDQTDVTVYVDFIQELDVVRTLNGATYQHKAIGGVFNAPDSSGSNADYFDGWIDEVRFYDYALRKDINTNFRANDAFDNSFYRQGYVKDDDSINENGILSRTIVDKSITNPDTLVPLAFETLDRIGSPIELYEIESIGINDAEILYGDYRVGDVVRLLDPDFEVDDLRRIESRTVNLNVPLDIKLTLATSAPNMTRDLTDVYSLQDLEQKAATVVLGAGSIVVKGTFSVIDIFTGGTTTIDGGNITANTITADKINVDELSALVAEVGQLIVGRGAETGGGDGYIRSTGATDFNVGDGFWMDESGNFFFGDASTGSDLQVNGDFQLGTGISADDWAQDTDCERIDLGGGDWVMRFDSAAAGSRIDQDVSIAHGGELQDGMEYIIRFRIRNYSTGTVRPLLGEVVGTNQSGNGTYEVKMNAGSANNNLTFQVQKLNQADPNPLLDIDDVQLFLTSSVGNAVIWDGSTLTIRGALDVSGDIHANNIIAGVIATPRIPTRHNEDPSGNVLGASTRFMAQSGDVESASPDGDDSWYILQTWETTLEEGAASIILFYKYDTVRLISGDVWNGALADRARGKIVLHNPNQNAINGVSFWADDSTDLFGTNGFPDPGVAGPNRAYYPGPTSDEWFVRELFLSDMGITTFPTNIRLSVAAKSSDLDAQNNRVKVHAKAALTVKGVTGVLSIDGLLG